MVDCAIDLIAERGYGEASVAKIGERAGITKSVVLYHFATKDELVGAVVTRIFAAAAETMLPAVRAEATAGAKLRSYIRANGEYITTHRSFALALLAIWTSFRTAHGLRLDEAAAGAQPAGELADLDPHAILVLGQRTREFRPFDPAAMAVAVRQAIDGAVLLVSRNPAFDVTGYCGELVTLFDRATRTDS
ncbi:MAG: TetR/AcrR family transcriptional regulator [Candidatus Dormibacteraceae bacterium]